MAHRRRPARVAPARPSPTGNWVPLLAALIAVLATVGLARVPGLIQSAASPPPALLTAR
jgi:hypothetical protein